MFNSANSINSKLLFLLAFNVVAQASTNTSTVQTSDTGANLEQKRATISLSSTLETNTQAADHFDKSLTNSTGLNVSYKFENGINFAARYNLGISNIVEDGTILGEEVDASDTKNYNNVFQVSVGYFF